MGIMMAKNIQSNICGMLEPFRPATAINGRHAPEVAGPCSRAVRPRGSSGTGASG